MNKYQKKFIDYLHEGKMPRTKIGRKEFELLGNIKDSGIVKGTTKSGEVYRRVADDYMDHIDELAGDLFLWHINDFTIEYL